MQCVRPGTSALPAPQVATSQVRTQCVSDRCRCEMDGAQLAPLALSAIRPDKARILLAVVFARLAARVHMSPCRLPGRHLQRRRLQRLHRCGHKHAACIDAECCACSLGSVSGGDIFVGRCGLLYKCTSEIAHCRLHRWKHLRSVCCSSVGMFFSVSNSFRRLFNQHR